MCASKDVVNIKTCVGNNVTWFCHFAKVSARNQNILGRTFFPGQQPLLNLPNLGLHLPRRNSNIIINIVIKQFYTCHSPMVWGQKCYFLELGTVVYGSSGRQAGNYFLEIFRIFVTKIVQQSVENISKYSDFLAISFEHVFVMLQAFLTKIICC